jgi:hypothetical protein
MFPFVFRGGQRKPTFQTVDKFMLFPVIGGREIYFHNAIKNGLIKETYEEAEHLEKYAGGNGGYLCPYPVVKLFLARQGFGIERIMFSLYMRFQEAPSPVVTISSLFHAQYPHSFIFKGRVKFLTNTEIEQELAEDSVAALFLKRSKPLPVEIIKKIVVVDRSEIRKGVRLIEIGAKKEETQALAEHEAEVNEVPTQEHYGSPAVRPVSYGDDPQRLRGRRRQRPLTQRFRMEYSNQRDEALVDPEDEDIALENDVPF